MCLWLNPNPALMKCRSTLIKSKINYQSGTVSYGRTNFRFNESKLYRTWKAGIGIKITKTKLAREAN